jgi:hypothetical protein
VGRDAKLRDAKLLPGPGRSRAYGARRAGVLGIMEATK